MFKSADQILAEKLARKEIEVANLLATNRRLAARLSEVSEEVAALKACGTRRPRSRQIDGEGDEANGAALWN